MWPPEPEEQRAAREATEAAARQEAERRERPLRHDLARLQEIEAMASIEAVRARPDAVEVLASAVRAACRRVASIQSSIQANLDFRDSIERAIQDEIDQFGSIDADRSTYLRQQQSPFSVGPRALSDGQEGAEQYSVELARLSPAAVLATLKELSRDEDASTRRSASACLGRVARELGQVGDASAVPVLVAALTEALVAGDEKAAERLRRALEALGPITTSVLVASLGDQAQRVRWTIVRLLGRVGSIEALPALRSTLDDEDESVRGEAEFAIAEIER